MTERRELTEHTEHRHLADATVAAYDAGEYPRDAIVTLVTLGLKERDAFINRVVIGAGKDLSADDKRRIRLQLGLHGETRWENP